MLPGVQKLVVFQDRKRNIAASTPISVRPSRRENSNFDPRACRGALTFSLMVVMSSCVAARLIALAASDADGFRQDLFVVRGLEAMAGDLPAAAQDVQRSASS